ncbi:MAG: phosphoglycerate dehydrogenase [Acidimicrobiia bacterium]|nr:phosphoglycerate dehydrogenase [Acidimicrobiia bacterium]MDH3396602.1 phosphoglycerate dehydrogenase [Acidimicrobiia bacterium]
MRPKVVIAEAIAEAGIEALETHCEVVNGVGLDESELLQLLTDAQALIVRSATQVDAEMIERGPHLKVIGRAGIGVDNIDISAATAAGIVVVNAPQANVISAAEHAMALLLSQARHVPRADAVLRSGVWDRKPYQGVELFGKTLGVIGLGRIGSLVAKRAQAFGMRVLAHDPYVGVDRARQLEVELADGLDELLSRADFITIHLPFTAETAGMINSETLARTRPGVRIVNASRGGIIDEDALAAAIRSGRVAGAALDVFATEPITESPLFELSQVVVTPHLGASTREAQDKAGIDVAEAVAGALRGELVLSAVNVDIGSDVTEEVRRFLPLAEHLGRVFVDVAMGLPDRLTVRIEGRLAEHAVHPLGLAVLKGALSAVSSVTVSYVNAPALAERHGIAIAEESSSESTEYVSLVRLTGTVGGREISLAGTIGRRAPMLVEMFGYEVDLPLSQYMLIVRNADVPGLIGRVGTFLGQLDVNIANMVVGRSSVTGEAAMMGIDIDQPLSPEVVDAVRNLQGVEEAQFVQLPLV